MTAQDCPRLPLAVMIQEEGFHCTQDVICVRASLQEPTPCPSSPPHTWQEQG